MPRRIPGYLWRRMKAAYRVARSANRRFNRDDGAAMSGYIAYSVFLSLFPFAIFMSALSGIMIGPEESRRIIDALFEIVPQHIAQTLEPVILNVIGESRGGLLTFSAIFALWIASNAVEAIRIAFDRAYDVETEEARSFAFRRAVAVGFVFVAGVAFAILGVVIIAAPLAITLAREYLPFHIPFGLGVIRYVLGLFVFALFLLILNRWLPSRAPRFRRVLPGILVSTILFLAGATGFSIYLAFAP
ncbi:MAG: YihY/virulence factor BrkB family protein, partial [Pseudomonadota bacterium]